MAHLSVRGLVEFTLHGESLTRGASMRDMLDGTVSHKARQKALGPGWESEVPLSMALPYLDEEMLTLSGRMDGFKKGDVPEIEEIKLFSGDHPPLSPYPAHRAQAVVYAHMVACQDGAQTIRIITCYVDKKGGVVAAFPETLSKDDCAREFNALYDAYAAWQETLKRHREKRDATLQALTFPYETYRKGQREMAVQVFTAISRQKRLLSELPTGTGKSAAVLFPSLMAMGRGLTEQIFYLTARTTQRKAAQECLGLFRHQPLSLWALTLTAREKQCFMGGQCDLDTCPYAIGFFTRLPDAVKAILPLENWDEQTIFQTAQQHMVCPFEFSLSLSEIADVVICDYNYAFDPTAHIQRVFDERRDMTLLIDESHNVLSRVRDMLSASIDTQALRLLRKAYPKRSHAMYKQLTALIKGIDTLEGPGVVPLRESGFKDLFTRLQEALLDEMGRMAATDLHFEIYMALKTFLFSLEGENHTYILEGKGRQKRLTAFCLSVAEHIGAVTRGMRGVVFFSATLSPLEEMKVLLGGEEEDAVFRMPSPFPPERFFLKRLRVNTRYAAREETAAEVAGAIRALFTAKAGKYIAFFPSFKYLSVVAEHLTDLPLLPQTQGMDEAARDAFLAQFDEGPSAVLGLCVMGGVFSEGVDLPGDRLHGVMLVGVGLPQVNIFQETLRDYYEQRFSQGFRYAYQIPGMHKILQAAGRVIRSETDRGAALLIDDRYFQRAYENLCPPHWRFHEGELKESVQLFWHSGD